MLKKLMSFIKNIKVRFMPKFKSNPMICLRELKQYRKNLPKFSGKSNYRIHFLRFFKLDFLRNFTFKISWSSLATQATITMALICIMPLSIIGWYFTNQTMESLTQAAIDKNNKVVDRIASDIGANIQSKKNFLMITSSTSSIRGMQKDGL